MTKQPQDEERVRIILFHVSILCAAFLGIGLLIGLPLGYRAAERYVWKNCFAEAIQNGCGEYRFNEKTGEVEFCWLP